MADPRYQQHGTITRFNRGCYLDNGRPCEACKAARRAKYHRYKQLKGRKKAKDGKSPDTHRNNGPDDMVSNSD